MTQANQYKVPILLLIFNRPSTTQKVFNEIKKVRPEKLYISADGARRHKEGEQEACNATRSICTEIDWPCEVFTLFHMENLGCGLAVTKGINWFFESEEEGIVLEDDCLPSSTFFSFCRELLEKYRYDDRIMQIAGTNFLLENSNSQDSYYFSRQSLIWGWATWRRAWEKFDHNIQSNKDSNLDGLNKWYKYYLNNRLQSTKGHVWDFHWFFSIWFSKGFVIIPHVSLVKNIGYGLESTHTFFTPKWLKKIRYGEIEHIKHPPDIMWNRSADEKVFKTILHNNILLYKLKRLVKPVVIRVFNARKKKVNSGSVK